VQRASDDVVVERGGRDTAYLYKGEDAGDASGEESSRRWRWSQVTTQQQREEATGPGPPTHVWCQWPEENYVDPGSIRRPMRLYGLRWISDAWPSIKSASSRSDASSGSRSAARLQVQHHVELMIHAEAMYGTSSIQIISHSKDLDSQRMSNLTKFI
jgi:hypothetical protein